MRIQSLDLYHLKIPCKNSFAHAKSTRDSSEVILIKLTSDQQSEGWGEIMPRDYVTGESIQSIMAADNARVAMDVFGGEFNSANALQEWVKPHLTRGRENLALLGGFELALWGLLSQEKKTNFESIVGAPRHNAVGHCFTIGFDCKPENVRKHFISARFKKATAIKLKVGRDMDRDIKCIRSLQELAANDIQIRLDGNGVFSMDLAKDLLCAIDPAKLHSFEEPLDRENPNVVDQLGELHSLFSIDLMADESICSQADADRIIEEKSYQWLNIRVGKHGGIIASSKIRDKAIAAGLRVVGGSMVGETSVLTQASTLFLHRSNAIDYVEGLGQNRTWLLMDPFKPTDTPLTDFQNLEVEQSVIDHCLVKKRQIHLNTE